MPDDVVTGNAVRTSQLESVLQRAGHSVTQAWLATRDKPHADAFHSRDELRIEYESLQQETAALQEQNTLLEQKIQAITDVEATISTRKEE